MSFNSILRAQPARNLIETGNRLFVAATVNGHAVTALLDSAAEGTLIDARFARLAGLVGGKHVEVRGSGGDTKAAMAEGVKIEVFGETLGPLTVAVLDLSDVGRRLLHGPLEVVIGRELFDAARWEIDLTGARMRSVPRSELPEGVLLPLTTERGVETFPASVEGHRAVRTVFDLGNGGDVLIGVRYAREIGALRDGRKITMKVGGGIGGQIERESLILRSIHIAGRRFTDVPASVDTTDSAASLNVGVSLLRQFFITSDYTQHKLWLRT